LHANTRKQISSLERDKISIREKEMDLFSYYKLVSTDVAATKVAVRIEMFWTRHITNVWRAHVVIRFWLPWRLFLTLEAIWIEPPNLLKGLVVADSFEEKIGAIHVGMHLAAL
jgi:hypothetical protein